MKETIEISLPDFLIGVGDQKIFEFFKKGTRDIKVGAAQICLREKMPEYRKDSVEKSFAENRGLVKYKDFYLPLVTATFVPQGFKDIIDKFSKNEVEQQVAS